MVRKMLIGFMVFSIGFCVAGAAPAEDQLGAELPEPSAQPQSRSNRQPTAEEMREMMQGVMGPMMGEMMSSMLKAMTKTMAEPQIAQNMATFARNYYQALIERGFTQEEALKIVTSTGVPNMGGKS